MAERIRLGVADAANQRIASQAKGFSLGLHIAPPVKRNILNNLYVASGHQTPCDLST